MQGRWWFLLWQAAAIASALTSYAIGRGQQIQGIGFALGMLCMFCLIRGKGAK